MCPPFRNGVRKRTSRHESHAQKILDKLIRAYEKSAHANPFQPDSNRRILFLKKKYPAYDVRDYGIVEEINEALQALADQDYITIEFDREHRNHMKRVALNLKELDTIYRREYGRLPKPERVLQLEQLLCFYHDKVHTAWMQEYLNDEMRYLKKKGTLHEYAGKDAEHIEGLLRVLCFLEENPSVYIRTMSTRLFQNSKYFEQELKSSFLSVLHRYEPGLVQAREEELELADSEVFAYLGFRMYPETFACWAMFSLC